MAAGEAPRTVPENTAYRTGYRDHYVRLGGERGRHTSLDPFNGTGTTGREEEIAAWLTRDVPPELRDARFDVATLLAKIEEMRDALWMAERNMIEAGRRAHEAERRAGIPELAGLLAASRLDAANLRHQNEVLAAVIALHESGDPS